jgi:hypothetical protein
MESDSEILNKIQSEIETKAKDHELRVLDSQHFKQELTAFLAITYDFVDAIRAISLYSTRAKDIYDEFLTIRSSDDIIQSAIGIRSLVVDGVHNMAKRELRYIIEMSVKYLIVDQEMAGKQISEKSQYLHKNIPNSSIEVIDRMKTFFQPNVEADFKNEIKDVFYKACAYVHPSKKQIDEQIARYERGVYIGFETAKDLSVVSRQIYRGYDLILTLLLIGFGQSMSGDLFIQCFDENTKWKFAKSKYVSKVSELYDGKCERMQRRGG